MNKMIKKVLALGLSSVFVASCFAGCSSNASSDDTSKTDSNKKYTIGICQLVQHDALDAATEGFKEAVIAELGEDNVTFDFQNAAGDSATCATICNGFVSENADLIMANATPALQAATAATTSIPIVATSVTDFATALDIKDWTGTTGTNVTGTSDLAPLDQQASMVKELFPSLDTIGILYCSAEANSVYQVKTIEKSFDSLGIKYKEYTCSDTNDIASVVTSACTECEALYIPTDNTLASCTSTIDGVALNAGVPIVAGEEGICTGCGIATLSISYHDIGYSAGKMAADILKNGKDPSTMEIQYASADGLTKEYDKDRAAQLGVTIPEGYTAIAKTE